MFAGYVQKYSTSCCSEKFPENILCECMFLTKIQAIQGLFTNSPKKAGYFPDSIWGFSE